MAKTNSWSGRVPFKQKNQLTLEEAREERREKLKGKKREDRVFKLPICPYCGKEGDLHGKKWTCSHCEDVSVGTYDGTNEPLGVMANKETRQWRVRAHDELSYKWQDGSSIKDFYGWVAYHVKKQYKSATIANLNEEECRLLIKRGRTELYNKHYRSIFETPNDIRLKRREGGD